MGTKVRLSVAVGDYEIIRALKEGAVPLLQRSRTPNLI